LIVQSEPLYPNDFRFLILPDGRLLYFSERVSSREYDPRTRLRVSLYDSAYDALEKTHHQSVQHAQETEQLTDTSVALTATISRFDRWRKDSPDDHKVVLRAEAAELPEDHNYLFGALSEDKTDAGGFIVSASTVTDARGSENPSATMSQLVAARNRLGNRDDSIRGVESYNSRDAHDIAKVIDEHEKLLLKFRQDLQENAYKIDDPNHSLFTDDLIGGAQSSARDMMFCLKIDPKPLRDIILEPFKTYTECILRQYEVLETALMERDQETARSALLRMHLIGKFQGVRKCFTGIKRDIIEPEYTTLFAIRDKLNLLKSYIERYQLFDGVIDAEYEPHFIELEERIDALLASVQNSLADTDDQQHDQRTSPFSDIYKELYDLIEEYDIEDIVSKLPCGKSIIESK
ncbi:MAG: hypothetical protein QF400_04740, partial [Candidatus Peribacteraceae bacterium]|nr:hypothetical protein [Candidatus Peribacteraceae bacterium]